MNATKLGDLTGNSDYVHTHDSRRVSDWSRPRMVLILFGRTSMVLDMNNMGNLLSLAVIGPCDVPASLTRLLRGLQLILVLRVWNSERSAL